MNSYCDADYGDCCDYDQVLERIYAILAREEFMRSLIGWRNIIKKILPTGTVSFAHRWRPTARTGLRYRDRKREGGEVA